MNNLVKPQINVEFKFDQERLRKGNKTVLD
jgi:hypothetical protein